MASNILYLKDKLPNPSEKEAQRLKNAIGSILKLDGHQDCYPPRLTDEAVLAADVFLDSGRSLAVAIRVGRYVLRELHAEHDRRITELLDLVSKKTWPVRLNANHYKSYHEAMCRARKAIDLGGTVNDVLTVAAAP